ncbi:hypothetical protein Mgra_00002579 [Meloidogyne graminicola]|uniref:PDZ domain-containing protein n=1 Tax=Meloidogyne graminicola TaxID=189291 RepID=A0A8S9ZXJ0_9BILA|nr:hypothetical protein Mgra_00002579 [Meloidogyne graminicola]
MKKEEEEEEEERNNYNNFIQNNFGFKINFNDTNKNIISNNFYSFSTQKSSKKKRKGSVSARLSYNGSKIIGSINHTESMELSLAQETKQSWPSFGIILGKQQIDIEGNEEEEKGEKHLILVIVQIEKGSPADKCGVLQPGDRILCIDDWHTTEGTLEEANHLLRILSLSGNRSVILLIEFNVIEPVLPPAHGSFFVMRLAKCGKCLGIVCQSQQNGTTKGEPLIISHIRTGSVAHRCGSIQVGDQIYSIDDIPLNTCTLDEAMRLLQRSARVIKLVIIKGGGQEQHLMEGTINQNFIFTIELLRRGRPLGITIASSGGHLDPIIISRLAPNGLAERTGALNIGDQILSVNGESLEGKKVSQVTQILQQCSDPILIKLCHYKNYKRIESEQNNKNIFGINSTPKKSLDSAMEFLEGSSPPCRQSIPPIYSSLRRPSINTQQTTDPLLSSYSDPYSSGGGNGGLDSGLSSADATDSQPGGQISSSHLNSQGKCCECQFELNESGNHSFCCLNSPNSSFNTRKGKKHEESDDDDWMRILEALESVSEAEMLRKLEECILNGNASNYIPPHSNKRYGYQQMFPSELGNILSHQPNNNNYDVVDNIQYNNNLINEIKCDNNNYKLETSNTKNQQNGVVELFPPPMPSPRISTTNTSFPFTISSTFVSSEKNNSNNSLPSCTIHGQEKQQEEENDEIIKERKINKFDEFSEVFSVQLKRCPLTKSFGFSVCDGPIGEESEIKDSNEKTKQLLSTGIYIRSLVKDGPAEKSERIKPKDRILQINGRSIQFLTCDLVLPLLTTETVDLLLLRKRKN